jgi:hypothetical protein
LEGRQGFKHVHLRHRGHTVAGHQGFEVEDGSVNRRNGGITMRETLIETYLDYRNNYLTVEKWAEHNGLTAMQGHKLIALAREVFETQHPES